MLDMNIVDRIDQALAPMCKAIGEKVQAAGDAVIEGFDRFMTALTGKIAEKACAVKEGFNNYVEGAKSSIRAQETPNTPKIADPEKGGHAIQKEITQDAISDSLSPDQRLELNKMMLEHQFNCSEINVANVGTDISPTSYGYGTQKSNVVGLGI